MPVRIVGVDADDTLWDEASLFERAERRFVGATASWTGRSDVRERLRALHFDLIPVHGYGIDGYRLALGEFCRTEIDGACAARANRLALELCSELGEARVCVLEGVDLALRRLKTVFRLVLITKGSERAQLGKLDRSGLSWAFEDVFVVSEKSKEVYLDVFGHPLSKPHAAMIGNSLKSDIVPALEAGAFGLHVPFSTTSPLEQAACPAGHRHFRHFPRITDAARWLVRGAR